MGIDLPPNLAGQAASAVVRQAEKAGQNNPNAQDTKRKKDEADDARNAAQRRAGEPGNR
jgi:hypothetical protein